MTLPRFNNNNTGNNYCLLALTQLYSGSLVDYNNIIVLNFDPKRNRSTRDNVIPEHSNIIIIIIII